MSLDRQSIERKDFPVAERGYNPAAVDAHLSALADEIERLKPGVPHSPTETLAGAVAEQVRGIVEAAENSAEEILSGAELEAQEIRARASQATDKATGEAQRVREHAAAQVGGYLERVSASIAGLLRRLEAIEGELNSLTASLRGDTERLRGDLAALVGDVSEARPAVVAPEPAEGAKISEPAERSSGSAKIGDDPLSELPPAWP